MTVQVAMTAGGRIGLPSDSRKRLGLAKGGAVYVDEMPDGILLRTAEQVVAHARALAKQYDQVDGGSVDDFLTNRVAEGGQ